MRNFNHSKLPLDYRLQRFANRHPILIVSVAAVIVILSLHYIK